MSICRVLIILTLACLMAPATFAEERDVQIRSIDFENEIMELYNFGTEDIDLDGWRFCSHDSNQIRIYTGSTGLDDVTIESGTSIFIYFDNDAPTDDDDALDRSDVGSFAVPLDSDAYGIQLYFPGATGTVSFANSALIADHIQWNDGGLEGNSEARTDQAVDEDLWTAEGDFIETTEDSFSITLNDEDNGRLHGPEDYDVSEPLPAERAIQIRSINFDSAIIELHNYGDEDRDLDGWRFCSHDGNKDREYSGATGLDGVTIESGTSFYIHYDSDGPEDDPDHIDRTSLGNFAFPLETTAYAMQLYFTNDSGVVSFTDSDLIADHVQWKEDGALEGTAEFRTDQAVDVGLWTAEGDWVDVTSDTVVILLQDDAADPHGPLSYDTFDCTPFVRGDGDDDGDVELDDVLAILGYLFSGDAEVAPTDRYDVTNDGVADIVDPIVMLVYLFLDGAEPDAPFPDRGCP